MSPFPIYAVELLQGTDAQIDDLFSRHLGNLIGMIEGQKRERLNGLSGPIDNKLRNSVAHEDFLIDPESQTIEFRDKDEVVTKLGYSDIRDMVIESKAVTITLFMFVVMVQHEKNMEALEEIDFN